mmetsp:Transcript_51668/g.102725  ORF Transcript_51668/g.102725 Transcript_51668/m.102725 type:complete len:439 (+) Transcript_51668:114-1430(+)|eukprot:CAMPEP_0172830694 /NCGR_PEP_ID=MMETSP1075-20121228/22437_1 /TAXON_ID=2916 /ORGANISM="Ceratium fusus, Strain PA161109" /LENGTH=438 /DNA_ID=CAMNT_0013673029 /DNA_START=98 /DNA_END=1414 /DNA_ORIENTATION=-
MPWCCFRSQASQADTEDEFDVISECSRPGCKQVVDSGLTNICAHPGCNRTSWNGQAGEFCSKRCRNAGPGALLCLQPGCGKPTWNGAPNEYCSKRCRDQQASLGVAGVPLCLKPGCGKPTWNGQPNEFCSKQCRSASPPVTSLLCLAPGCGKPTWNGKPNEFCSKQCKGTGSASSHSGVAKTAVCLKPGCGKPTWNGMQGEFCSKICRNSISVMPPGGGRLESMCVQLGSTDPTLGRIKQHFVDKWDTSRGTPTTIRAVYEVFPRTSLVQAFRQECDNIGHVQVHGSGTNPGNVQRRFHGTPLQCDFQGSSCTDPDCNTCRIIQDGFDLAKLGSWSKNKGHYGGGIYFTSMSSTAKGYGINTGAGYSFQKDNWRDAGAGNSVLLVNIACGKVEKVTDKCNVPIDKSKYHSRTVDKTNGADELVIFDEQKALVRYVIVF